MPRSSSSPDAYVRLDATMKVFIETENAIGVCRSTVDRRSQIFEKELFWVPKQFLDHDENELSCRDDVGDLVIPRWIADKNDITDYEYVD